MKAILPRFLLLLSSLVVPQVAAAPQPATKPNIVVILTDDQGRGDYGACGTKDIQTPQMDRLFREGLTFRHFYANSCVCSPTRAALLSGCFPDRVGVPGVIRDELSDDSWGCLAPRVKLIPQVLASAGYHCALIGKWHLGLSSPNLPNERGFNQFDGFLGDMMDDYWTHQRNGANYMRHNREVIDPKGHATDLFSDWACAYLEARAHTAAPFFLYLAYNAPHGPLQPPPAWLATVRQREPQMTEARAKLVALIEHLDAGIGKVLATLDSTGLAANTLVIFSSDNGGDLASGANNGSWRGGKGQMYEGGLRVPGAARWPGVIAAGSQSARMTMTMDIFATACAVAGVAAPAHIDGVSFLPELRGETPPAAARDLYFVRREGGSAYAGKTIEALRRGDWKLLQDSPFAPLELYNVQTDPLETNNVAAQNGAVFNALSAALRKQVQRGGAVPWQPAP
jgi:arylsulfatase A-like enzyme